MDWRPNGGRLLGLHRSEVEGLIERGGSRTNWVGAGSRSPKGSRVHEKKESQTSRWARRRLLLGVHVALAYNIQVNPGRAQKRCKFAEVAGCTRSHPPWLCKAFGDKAPEERKNIITDNKFCPFCLLHNAGCGVAQWRGTA